MSIRRVDSLGNYLESFVAVPDEIYGAGTDGSVTISSNTTLTRDMYYENLTIASGVHVNTAGYRVFVRKSLNFSSASANQSTTSIGLKNGSSAVGTLSGGSTTSVTNSLGGASATNTATAPSPAGFFDLARNAVAGYMLHAGQTTALNLRGGAGDGTNPGGGVVVVCARKVYGYGSIYATGFNNGSSFTTGGGVIVFCSQDAAGPNLTLSVSGYASGTIETFIV